MEVRFVEIEIGKITHYYTNLGVGVIELADTLTVGDTIHVQGATTDFTQKVESIQIDSDSVAEARTGDAIGLAVQERVREGDTVYKLAGV